jgi:hypothetical protein
MSESTAPGRKAGAQSRIDLAFRRLQLGLLRSGYTFDGGDLEEAVKATIWLVEKGQHAYATAYAGPRSDCGCPDRPDEAYQPHPDEPCDWSHWHSNRHADGLREDRFCWKCGSVETQDLKPSQSDAWVGAQWCREHGSYHSVHPGWCPECRKKSVPPVPPLARADEHTLEGRSGGSAAPGLLTSKAGSPPFTPTRAAAADTAPERPPNHPNPSPLDAAVEGEHQ